MFKRASQGGEFGGISTLEKKRQYRAVDDSRQQDNYGMVFDREEMQRQPGQHESYTSRHRERSRSRSPTRKDPHRDRGDRHHDRHYDGRHRDEQSHRGKRWR